MEEVGGERERRLRRQEQQQAGNRGVGCDGDDSEGRPTGSEEQEVSPVPCQH